MSTGTFPQYMHSEQLNAPQLTSNKGAIGQILTILDEDICNGCIPNTAASVSLSGDMVKITFGVLHGYLRLQFLDITGATSAAFNGKHRIVKVDATSVYIAKGSITDLTGTIKTKLSPLGWENMFGTADALKRAYRSPRLDSTRTVLYLDCELKGGTKYNKINPMKAAKVNACRDMLVLGDQIDSHTLQFNGKTLDGMLMWMQAVEYYESYEVSEGIIKWSIFGDDKLFYFCVAYANTNTPEKRNSRAIYAFGDLPRLSNADQYNCILTATEQSMPSVDTVNYGDSGQNVFDGYVNDDAETKGCFFIRSSSGLAKMERWNRYAMIGKYNGYSGDGGFGAINPLTFGLTLSPISVKRRTEQAHAGDLPYIRAIGNNLSYTRSTLDLQLHNDYLIMRVAKGNSSSPTESSYIAVDLMEERRGDNLL